MLAINQEDKMVNAFLKIKKHITVMPIAIIEAVNTCMSIILDRKEIKNALKGVMSFKLPSKSNLRNGSNKNRESIEKNAARKLQIMITQSLDL